MPRKIVIPIIVGMILISFCNTIFSIYYLYIQTSTYIQSFFFLFLFFSSIIILLRKNKFSGLVIRITFLDLSLIFFLLYFVIQFFISNDYKILFDRLLLFITFSIFYLILAATLDNSNQKVILSILYTLSLIGCLQIVYSIFQSFYVFPTFFDFKFGGTFGNPGDLANFLALTYSITLGLLFIEKSKQKRILLEIILLFHLFLIGISLARTAWLATITASVFILAINIKPLPFWLKIKLFFIKEKWLVPIVLFSVIAILGLVGWIIYELKPDSANGRLFIWQLCIQIIAEKPLFGHGYESFITVLRNAQIEYFSLNPHDIKNGMLAANSVFAFNDFLQFAVEYGMAGALLLLSLFILPFRNIKSTGGAVRGIITTVKGAVIALFTCTLFSYPLQNQTILILFVILLAIISSFDQTFLFQFSISPKIKITLSTILLVGCLSLTMFNYKKVEYGLKWKQASELLTTNPKEGAIIYEIIYDFMKHNRSFISNYGTSFYYNVEFQKVVDYYERYGYFNPSTDILLMTGESYEKLNNYPKAEEKYRMASNLIPHLFVPRYRLFKLYIKQGEYKKAQIEAKEISTMQIKVYSDIVKKIKTEVNEYLFNLIENPQQNENQPTSYQ